jgi:quercetin dioxygenase-like cupin family protein
MLFKVRRIVTTHDASGKAVVGSDELVEALPGVMTKEVGNALIWATDSIPVDLNGGEPPTQQLEPAANGTIFRILELPPGVPPRMHKTETIDYVLVLDGEVDMLLDDSEVHMTAGDVMVQKGTWHGWTNRSDRPCRIAFVLIDAK